MRVESVGIIGYGHFGQFMHELAQKFFPQVSIKIHSRHIGEDGALFVSFEEACQVDIILICCSISDYEPYIKRIVEVAPMEAILVDVATVKKHTSELLRKYAEGRKFLSTHPMFGPESYKKHQGNVDGFRIVVTDYALANDDVLVLKNIFATLGFLIIEMTADEHDKRLAHTLFVTHYIAQTIGKNNDIERTNIDTLSFQFLMDAVESVIQDTELFQDVYKYNPYCKEVVEKLHLAADTVYDDLKKLET